jgi:hypothetical protein
MCGCRMFVGKFTVLVRRSCMMLCVLMLAHRVMVLSLMVMMGRGVMMSRGQMMMLLRRMLRCLCHLNVPPFSVMQRGR